MGGELCGASVGRPVLQGFGETVFLIFPAKRILVKCVEQVHKFFSLISQHAKDQLGPRTVSFPFTFIYIATVHNSGHLKRPYNVTL